MPDYRVRLVGPRLQNGSENSPAVYLWSVTVELEHDAFDGGNVAARALAIDEKSREIRYYVWPPQSPRPRVEKGSFRTPRSLVLSLGPGGKTVSKLRFAYRSQAVDKGLSLERGETIVAEPLPTDQGSTWPDQPMTRDEIWFPPMRLVSGNVPIDLKVGSVLEAEFRDVFGAAPPRLLLTPSGIEFDGELPLPPAFFQCPGVKGRFRLAQTLYSDRSRREERDAYTIERLRGASDDSARAAWNCLVNVSNSSTGISNRRAAFSAFASNDVPGMLWLAERAAGEGASPSVSLARKDLQRAVDWSSPHFDFSLSGRRGTDPLPAGIAQLKPATVRMAGESKLTLRALRFLAKETDHDPTATASYAAREKEETWTVAPSGSAAVLDYDALELAAKLRSWHGLKDSVPALKPRDGEQSPAHGRNSRPYVWGFTPVDRGWLQFPVPNLPEPDLADDRVRVRTAQAVDGAAIAGFARFSNVSGAAQEGYSPFENPDFKRPGEVPWSATLESAAGVDGAWEFVRTGDSSKPWKPGDVSIEFISPRLSFGGLLWVSRDRPDAEEGLPRLAAGPGGFEEVRCDLRGDGSAARDAPLVLELTKALTVTLWKKTEQSGPRLTGGEIQGTLDGNSMAAFRSQVLFPDDFSGRIQEVRAAIDGVGEVAAPPSLTLASIAWLRHDRMPLVAQMSMTRSAAGVARPLESRDLAPFKLNSTAAARGLLVFSFEWGKTASGWPSIGADLKPVPLGTWPQWTGGKERDPTGVGFAVVGAPGAEIQPQDTGWENPGIAYRFDLPILDEGFAAASPPPAPFRAGAAAPADSEQPPTPSAIDLPELVAFWRHQASRHSLSRAQSVYAFRPESGDLLRSLVEPFVLPAHFELMSQEDPGGRFPIGHASIEDADGQEILSASGDRALLGASGTPVADPTTGLLSWTRGAGAPTGLDVNVRGWSPATFADGEFETDSRGVGFARPKVSGDWVVQQSRLFEVEEKQDGTRTFSSRGVLGISTRGPGVPLALPDSKLSLILTNVPMEGDAGAFELAKGMNGEQSLSSWARDEAPLRGFEWRLVSSDGTDDLRDDFALFGFRFLPLQLDVLKATIDPVTATVDPTEVSILGRLDVADAGNASVELGFEPPDNRVRVTFTRSQADGDGANLVLSGIGLDGAKPPSFNPPLGDNQQPIRDLLGEDPLIELRSLRLEDGKLYLQPVLVTAVLGRVTEIECTPRKIAPGSTSVSLEQQSSPTTGLGGFSGSIDLATNRLEVGQLSFAVATEGVEFKVEWSGSGWSTGGTWLQARIASTSSRRVRFDPARGTLSLQWEADQLVARESLFRGFPVGGMRIRGLAVFALDPTMTGSPDFRATTGWIDLEAWDGKTFVERLRHRVSIEESTATHDLRVWGSVWRESAIRWPKAKLADNRLEVVPQTSRSHKVQLRLSGHEIPFAALDWTEEDGWFLARPLDLLCVMRHVFDSDTDRAWLGVGRVRVEDWQLLDSDRDTLTFAPRTQVGGPVRNAGLMQSGDALGGIDGRRFAQAFSVEFPEPKSELIVYVTWIGVIPVTPDAPTGKLVTLPALYTASNGSALGSLEQSDGNDWQVATFDGPQELQLSGLHTAERTLDFGRGLTAAEIRRALDDSSGVNRSSSGVVSGVEQFVARRVPPAAPSWRVEPFWIRSMLALDSAWEACKTFSAALSFVPRATETEPPTSAGGWVHLVEAPKPETVRRIDDSVNGEWTILSGGDGKLVEQRLPRLKNQQSTDPALHDLAAVVAGRRHVRTRFAVVMSPDGARLAEDEPRAFAIPLPAPVTSDVRGRRRYPLRPATERAFPSPQRGWPAANAPSPSSSALSLPPVPGAAGPIRDLEGEPASGIAGLQTALELPRFAAPATPGGGIPKDLVWLSQKRVTQFLTPEGAVLEGPPAQWLSPLSPRVRLPKLDPIDDAKALQAFLPPVLSRASVGERAGVPTAVRDFLVADMGLSKDLDPGVARFGRAAAAGPSVLRQFRTPRPGPLPPNTTQVARRTCPWPGRLAPNHESWVGSVDLVHGIAPGAAGAYRWAVWTSVQPATGAVVPDRWDGSLQLMFQVEIAGEQPAISPADWILTSFLRGEPGKSSDEAGAAKARLSLLIAGREWIFNRIRLVEGTDFEEVDGVSRGTSEWVARLVTSDEIGGTRAARPDLEAALAERSAREGVYVELTATLDFEARQQQPAQEKSDFDLDIDRIPAGGKPNPPVRVRVPLFPIRSDEPALPLVPLTVAFVDPAYDETLATAPGLPRPKVIPWKDTEPPLGRAEFVVATDRVAYRADETLAFVVDARFERHARTYDDRTVKLDPHSPAKAVRIELTHQRKGVELGKLKIGGQSSVDAELHTAYAVSLAELRHEKPSDGTPPPALEPGDVIQMTVSSDKPLTFEGDNQLILSGDEALIHRVNVVGDPALPPPPSIYATLFRVPADPARIASTMVATSPPPSRVSFVDLTGDIRDGRVRYNAVFRWVTTRPAAELDHQDFGVFVVKTDFNGQTHLPEEKELQKPLVMTLHGEKNVSPAGESS